MFWGELLEGGWQLGNLHLYSLLRFAPAIHETKRTGHMHNYLNSWDQLLVSAHAPSGLSYSEIKPFSWVLRRVACTLAGRHPFSQVQQDTH